MNQQTAQHHVVIHMSEHVQQNGPVRVTSIHAFERALSCLVAPNSYAGSDPGKFCYYQFPRSLMKPTGVQTQGAPSVSDVQTARDTHGDVVHDASVKLEVQNCEMHVLS